MHAHYRVTFNSFCRSENSLVSLLISIVWVYRFTGVESERHVFYAPRWQMSCFSSWSGLSLLLWAVLGASTPLIASDRLSQRLQLFSFLWFLCIWCVSPCWDKKKQNVWQTVMILKQLSLFDCSATVVTSFCPEVVTEMLQFFGNNKFIKNEIDREIFIYFCKGRNVRTGHIYQILQQKLKNVLWLLSQSASIDTVTDFVLDRFIISAWLCRGI